MRRVHVIVRGDVQGVGYRYTLRMVAEAAAVTGWTRNLRDGTVEAELAGDAVRVDEVLAWMAGGPPGARVDSAIVTDLSLPTGQGADATAPASGSFEVRATA